MRYFVSLIVVLFTAAGAAGSRAQAQQAALPPEVIYYADTVLYNGKILTADPQFSVAEAVAIRGGRFLAVGPSSRILPMAGPNTRRIDLKGKTVTPGILNMHGDAVNRGLSRHWTKKFLSGEPEWTTKEEAVEGLKRILARVPPGEPVMLQRFALTGRSVEELAKGSTGSLCDVFTLQEIDALSPNNPVFFIAAVNDAPVGMNSKGAEVTKRFLPKGVSTPFVRQNDICLTRGISDGWDGALTPGQWAANDYVVWYEPPNSEAVLPSYREVQRIINAAGIVLGRDHGNVPAFNGVHALWERKELTVRSRLPFPITPVISGNTVQVPFEEAETLFRRWTNLSKLGDNMFRVFGIRAPAVGGNAENGMSWMLEPKVRPYANMWGNPAPYGGMPGEQEALEKGLPESFRGREGFVQAVRFGWDVAADHTEGDRAFREVIKAYEEGLATQVVKRPTQRLTTGHTPMSHPDDIAKAAKLGIWSNISTGHAIGTQIESALLWAGTERVDKWAPIKSFIKAGMHPSLEGTFWAGGYIDPATRPTAFFWISKYITRKDEKYGRVWNPTEALTRQEALWAATIWGAEQLNEHAELGNLVVGKEADLVIIDKDYLTIPPDDIQKIKVLLTMVGGKVVYEVAGAL